MDTRTIQTHIRQVTQIASKKLLHKTYDTNTQGCET